MKTRNYLLAIAMFLFAGASTMNAQVTIGGKTTPQATLDVVVSDLTDKYVPEGVIAPRLTLEQLQFKNDAYTTAQDGVIVYVDDITTGTPTPAGKTINVKAIGYYYYDGKATTPVWKSFGGDAPKQFYRIKPDGVYINDVRNVALSQAYIDNGNKYHVTGDEDFVIMEIATLGEIVLPTTSNAYEGKTILLLNQNTTSGNTVVSGLKNKAVTSPLPWGRGYYIIWVAGNGGYLQVRT